MMSVTLESLHMNVFSTPAKSQTIKTALLLAWPALTELALAELALAALAAVASSEKVSTQITWLRELCGLLGVGAVFRFVSMYSTISVANGFSVTEPIHPFCVGL